MYPRNILDIMGLSCDNGRVKDPRHAGMYVESPSKTYRARDGQTRTYRTHLLRRSYRDGGKVKKETLANLSALPDTAIAALKASLSGSVLVDAGDMFEIERSLPHGHVAAAHVMASRLGLKKLLGPDCEQRDLAYGLIIARAVAPASKLATTRWWADTTLGIDLGIAGASTDEVYAAMDWLLSRQDAIEKKLAARHLAARRPGIVRFVVGVAGRPQLPAGRVRAFPGREEEPGADRVRHGHQPGRDPGRGPGISREYLRLGGIRGNHPGRARQIRAR